MTNETTMMNEAYLELALYILKTHVSQRLCMTVVEDMDECAC